MPGSPPSRSDRGWANTCDGSFGESERSTGNPCRFRSISGHSNSSPIFLDAFRRFFLFEQAGSIRVRRNRKSDRQKEHSYRIVAARYTKRRRQPCNENVECEELNNDFFPRTEKFLKQNRGCE